MYEYLVSFVYENSEGHHITGSIEIIVNAPMETAGFETIRKVTDHIKSIYEGCERVVITNIFKLDPPAQGQKP